MRLCSSSCSAQVLPHPSFPEPWFAWQYQLSLLMQVPWAHPSLFLCSALLD